jgi:hypothetical protein
LIDFPRFGILYLEKSGNPATHLQLALLHFPDSSVSLTPPLAMVAGAEFSLVTDSILTPTTSPDEESLEPWIQTV